MSKLKTITFTKKEVLKAIKNEPLVGGNGWAKPKNYASRQVPATETNCTVCAVGGLFRQKFAKRRKLTISALVTLVLDAMYRGTGEWSGKGHSVERHKSEMRSILGQKDYLTALSNHFEYLAGKYPIEKVRILLSRWAAKKLPVKFKAKIAA